MSGRAAVHRWEELWNGLWRPKQSIDLQPEDTDWYTCVAYSEKGETSWSAHLMVEKNPSSNLHRASHSGDLLPAAPSVPKAVNITNSNVTLVWAKSGGSSDGGGQQDKLRNNPVTGYTVEYYSPDDKDGWIRAVSRIAANTATITNLKPSTPYMFIVRAENAHGYSAPSPLSNLIRTLSADDGVTMPEELEAARMVLNGKILELVDAVPVSSTSVRLEWQLHISSTEEYIEGLYVRYRDLSSNSQKYSMLTISNNAAEMHDITNLAKFTRYEFFLTPYFKNVEGQPSNSKIVQTLEDAPTAAPVNIQTGMLNLTAGWVKWSPPPVEHQNGVLLGYKIQVKSGNSSKILASMTLNATTTSVMLNNLTTGATYRAQIVAYNRIGVGPYSKPSYLIMDPAHVIAPPRAHNSLSDIGGYRHHNFMHETWFMIFVVLALLIILTFTVVGVVVFFKKRQNMSKAIATVPVITSSEISSMNMNMNMNISRKDCLWIDRGWRSTDTDKDSGLSEMKLLEGSQNPSNYTDVGTDYAEVDPRSITSFYNCRKSPDNPSPYATTMIMNGLPNENGKLPYQETYSSAASSVRSDIPYGPGHPKAFAMPYNADPSLLGRGSSRSSSNELRSPPAQPPTHLFLHHQNHQMPLPLPPPPLSASSLTNGHGTDTVYFQDDIYNSPVKSCDQLPPPFSRMPSSSSANSISCCQPQPGRSGSQINGMKHQDFLEYQQQQQQHQLGHLTPSELHIHHQKRLCGSCDALSSATASHPNGGVGGPGDPHHLSNHHQQQQQQQNQHQLENGASGTCSSDGSSGRSGNGSGTGSSSGSGGFSQRSKFARQMHVNMENALNGNNYHHHQHHQNGGGHHHHHQKKNHHHQQHHQEPISEREETENDKMLNTSSYSCGDEDGTLSESGTGNGVLKGGLGTDDYEDDTCCSCSDEGGSFLYEEPMQVK